MLEKYSPMLGEHEKKRCREMEIADRITAMVKRCLRSLSA